MIDKLGLGKLIVLWHNIKRMLHVAVASFIYYGIYFVPSGRFFALSRICCRRADGVGLVSDCEISCAAWAVIFAAE